MQFFASHTHSQRVHLAAAGPQRTEILYDRTGGVKGDDSNVNNFYALATRWNVQAKIDS